MTNNSGHIDGQLFMQHKALIPLLILVSLLTINPRINGWNEASRMALTQSLVEHHELTIDKSTFAATGDKVYVNGHYYSDKPAAPSLLAALVYFPLHHLGVELSYGWSLAYYLIIFFIIKSLWIFSILAFGTVMRLLGTTPRQALINTMIYAFASQLFTWSSTFNNHSIAASLIMLAFAFYMRSKQEATISNYALSGLFFGLAAASDLPTGLFFLGFAFLVLRVHQHSTLKLAFIGAGMLPLAIHSALNYQIGGTLLPLQFIREYLNFDGSQWSEGVRVNTPLSFLEYMFLSFVGPQGFLVYSPLVAFLIPLLVKHSNKKKPFYQESRVIAASSILLLLTYFILTQNYGGWGYGIRWFVPLIPLIYIFLFDVDVALLSSRRRWLFSGLVYYSFIVAVIGLINPWSNPEIHAFPILANLKQLSQFLF